MAIENEGSDGLITTNSSSSSSSNSAVTVNAAVHQQQKPTSPSPAQPSQILVPSTSASSISVAAAIATFNGSYNGNQNNKNNSIINNSLNSGHINNSNNLSNSNGISSLKSETSSNTSLNGSIKKSIYNSNSNQLYNNRDDCNSLGGGSSINSHSTTNNNINTNNKNSKDILHNHFYGPGNQNQMHENDGLGPLPLKWEKAFTDNGELYFIDHNTGTSHWLDPRLSKFQKKSLEDCSDDELPYGWEKIDDTTYGTYFIDHVNRRTQYENPVLEAKRRAERNRTTLGPPPQHQNGPKILPNYHHHHHHSKSPLLPYTFTRNPAEMRGERITTTLLKSARGLGITIVGGDDSVEEFLQIKSIVPNGPAWLDGKLQTGDILVYVNDVCVLGFTHHEMVNVFQSILPGETATLEVCRGYPLPFDPNDPNTEVITTIAVDGINTDDPNEKSRLLMDLNMDGNYNFIDMNGAVGGIGISPGQKNPLAKIHAGNTESSNSNENYIGDDLLVYKKPEILLIEIVKGIMGFGFTIADSAYGQKVKKILDRNCCKNLLEGDMLLEINNTSVKHMSHSEVVQVLKDCPKTKPTIVKIQRNVNGYSNRFSNASSTLAGLNGVNSGNKIYKKPINGSMFRSKTPTADIYSTQVKEILPIRPKTPLVDTRRDSRARAKTPSNELNDEVEAVTSGGLLGSTELQKSSDTKSQNSLHEEIDSINNDIPFMDPYPKMVTSLSERLAEAHILNDPHQNNLYTHPMDIHSRFDPNSLAQEYSTYGARNQFQPPLGNGIYSSAAMAAPMPTYHHESCYCYECQDYNRYQLDYQQQMAAMQSNGYNHNSLPGRKQREFLMDRRKPSFSSIENHALQMQPPQYIGLQPHQQQQFHAMWKYGGPQLMQPVGEDEYVLSEVTLEKHALGFGFRVVGGTEEGTQVAVGHIVPGGSADGNPRIETGDEILSIDGVNVINSSHHKVVSLMSEASALRGQVSMILRRRIPRLHNNVQTVMPPVISTNSIRTIQYPYDVIVSRQENESFGFVIISSANQFYGSTIGKLIPDSPAERCGKLKVGDRIIAVNRVDIAGMIHGEVVNLIKESGLHVRLTIGCPQEGISPNILPQQILSSNDIKHEQQLQQNHLMQNEYFDRTQHPQL